MYSYIVEITSSIKKKRENDTKLARNREMNDLT